MKMMLSRFIAKRTVRSGASLVQEETGSANQKYRREEEHWHGQGQVGGIHCPEDESETDDGQDTRDDHGAIICRPDNQKTPGCRDHKEQDSRQEDPMTDQDRGVQCRDMVFALLHWQSHR